MKIYLLIIGVVILASCAKKNDEANDPSKANSPSETYNNKVSENMLATEPSVYSNYFSNDSPLVGFSALKKNSLADDVLIPVYSENDALLKSGKVRFSMVANGVDIIAEQNGLKSSPITKGSSLFENWYGKNVSFVFKKEGLLKSGSLVEQDTIEMYIPKLVQITSPEIKTEEELYPFCYYDNFKLNWPPDYNNKNGMVVIVEWNGTVLSEEGDSKEYVRNIDVITEDNGEAILNNKLFDNIPDRALAYVTLLRGNITLAEIDGMTYRLFGESHAVLPMVLIRNLEK